MRDLIRIHPPVEGVTHRWGATIGGRCIFDCDSEAEVRQKAEAYLREQGWVPTAEQAQAEHRGYDRACEKLPCGHAMANLVSRLAPLWSGDPPGSETRRCSVCAELAEREAALVEECTKLRDSIVALELPDDVATADAYAAAIRALKPDAAKLLRDRDRRVAERMRERCVKVAEECDTNRHAATEHIRAIPTDELMEGE